MPWVVNDVDKHKKGLTPAQKKTWVKVANGVLKACQKTKGKDCEGKAIRIANSKFDLAPDGIWTFDNWDQHDEHFGLAKKPQDKPGGSNVGKYRKGPFCGPSGGAPKGSYPVNTRKRAIAAISYSRHAPNPAGIKKCVCRHWPSLPACSKKKKSEDGTMNERTIEKTPKAALAFVDHNCFAKVSVGKEGDKPRLEMIAYSGKVIKGHWWWGNLAIDLSGMKFPKAKYPILESHNTDKKIAFMGKPIVGENLKIDSDTVQFVDTPQADEFIKLSKEGFPYESSIYAQPTTVERVGPDDKAEVNGFTLRGPGTIWRQSIFKEASVCVFGHDPNTRSAAFADEEIDLEVEEVNAKLEERGCTDKNNLSKEEVKGMDLNEFKEANPDAFTELMEEAKGKLKTEFDAEKKILEDKHSTEKTGLEKEKTDLETKMAERDKRVLQLEKNDAIRAENEIRVQAEALFDSKLSESSIPDHLHDKVRKMVGYADFVAEGVLDVEKFTKAVDAEIKDWEDKRVTSTVLGSGFSKKEVDGNTEEQKLEDKENEDAADELLSLAGQPQKKAA